MASAFELLKPGARAEVKANRKLEPQKDYTTDAKCLRCHTNGFGHLGGYPDPAVGDSRAAQANAGIGCESCHGPADAHVQDWEKSKPKLPTSRADCTRCHARIVSRPDWYPQIDPKEHNPDSKCIDCHEIHPAALDDAKAREGTP